MITLDQLKKKIIEIETEWRKEVHEGSPAEEQMFIHGMIDDINAFESVEDILDWYCESGYRSDEAIGILLDIVLKYGKMD